MRFLLIWFPMHSEIGLNEKADLLAKCAIEVTTIIKLISFSDLN